MFLKRYIIQIISTPNNAIIKKSCYNGGDTRMFYNDYGFNDGDNFFVWIAPLSLCRYFNDKFHAQSAYDLLNKEGYGAKIIEITYKPIFEKEIKV